MSTDPEQPARRTVPSNAADRARQVRFRRAVSLMVMTLLAPGSAQLLAGDRRIGRIALWTWLTLWVLGLGLLVAVAARPGFAFYLASNTVLLGVARVALILLALGWAGLFVDAWRLGQPLTLVRQQRLAVVSVNGVLSLGVAAVLLFGSHLVAVQRDLMITMFGSGEVSGAHDGRFNVLLLGGDSGAGRWGLRPDSINLASIDAETGRTVLISLPRNLSSFPFAEGSVMDRQFPDGFDCEGCYLNGVSTWAGDHTELFKHSKHPGVSATIQAVEGITGLRVNYWAMVNLMGFRELVDAVGGVELNVRQQIPVGLPTDSYFRYLEPGVRTLDGQETLWFARARYGSDDYSRMARQKCVMSAMLQQVDPSTMLTNFRDIAAASSDTVSTNLPASEVDRFLQLALKAKAQRISTVSLVPPLIVTADPDIALIHTTVADAIAQAEGRPTSGEAAAAAEAPESSGEPAPATEQPKKQKKAPPPVTGGSVGSLRDGYAANDSDDVAKTC